VIWVIDHKRDLEADFRAFFHLGPREARSLPGPEFLALAYRTMVFPGVMASRAAKIREDQTRRTGSRSGETRVKPSTAAVLQGDANLSPYIEYATTPRR
jgi:hypothetical protein